MSTGKLGIYYTLGDGGLEESVAIFEEALNAGAKLLEVGLPFSDPLLDGPIIQQSHTRTLAESKFTWTQLMKALEHLVQKAHSVGAQVSVMCSLQLLYTQPRRDALPKVDGVLLTDISATKHSGVSFHSPRVWFVSGELAQRNNIFPPTDEPLSMIYLTRIQGVTGEGQQEDPITKSALERLRKICDLPIWLGFGITTKEDVQRAWQMGAHGAIIGSAFVKAIQNTPIAERRNTARQFVAEKLAR
jgi:tryptophan synthase alpha chain